MRLVMVVVLLSACGMRDDDDRTRETNVVTVRISGGDPRLAGCVLPASPTLQARVLVEGISDACAMTIADTNGKLVTRGECASVPTGGTRRFTLQWFVVDADSAPRLIAESRGSADLSAPNSRVVEILFDTPGIPRETSFDSDRNGCTNLQELCGGC